MPTFDFKVKIQAKDNAEAKKILKALFDIKKAVSTDDLLFFSSAIVKKPGLVKQAKRFL